MEAVRSCLEGIERNVPVMVKPAAAKLLMPNTVRTVADILALAEWHAEQLRLVVERWQPAAEEGSSGCANGRQGASRPASTPSRRLGAPPVAAENFCRRGGEGGVPDIAFGCVPMRWRDHASALCGDRQSD